MSQLCEHLEDIPVPTSLESQYAWKNFADRLAGILTEERGFNFERQINFEQMQKFNTYFAANERLVQCLDLATVSDRAGIKAGLLAPPPSVPTTD